MNKCIFVGHVGRDPEIRTTQSGEKVASFSVAVSKRWKDKSGQRQEKTEWVNMVAFKGLAGVIEQYVRKGTLISAVTEMVTQTWDDQNGQKRYKTEFIINDFELLGKKSDDNSQPNQPQSDNDDFENTIPF